MPALLICVALYFLFKWAKDAEGPPHEFLLVLLGLILYYATDSFLIAMGITLVATIIDLIVYS